MIRANSPLTFCPQLPDACSCQQEKKAAEEARKKELEALFATSIKQPKVPPGGFGYVWCM